MADRGPVYRTGGRPATIVVGPRDYPPDIPAFETPNNREPSGASSRLQASRAQVALTVNASQACVPVMLGGPLLVGGYVIYAKQTATFLYLDFGVCEGPLAIGSIASVTLDGKSAASLGATVETHNGGAGDTTSSLISAVEPTYTIPEGLAHVAMKIPSPSQTTGEYNPFNFQCVLKGLLAQDLVGGGSAWTTNPVRLAYRCLSDSVFGPGFSTSTDLVTAEWQGGQNLCDADIDPGAGVTKRWEISLRIDQQDTVDNWMGQVLDHCCGHIRHDGSSYGLWLDEARAIAQDSLGSNLLFTDEGTAANLSAKPTYTLKGRNEVPTVVIVDYVDVAAGYVDSSVQVPAAGPSGDWIEMRFSRTGITTIERARRMATRLYNINHLQPDITLEPWMTGALPLEGDRVLVRSKRLIPATTTPPNSGATAGVEEVVITDQTISATGTVLRASLYRDATFDDTIDTSGGPTPPGQTPNAPAAPTGLVLTPIVGWENGVLVARISIDWTPAAEPYSSFTRILYSRDGVNFDELGTGFQVGPAVLENATLGVQHYFQLYTVRTSTGQVSSALTGSVVPTYTDQTLPEVTQGIILPNPAFGATLECYPPIPSVVLAPRNQAPIAGPTLALAAGGLLPIGVIQFAYARITSEIESHLSPTVSITTDAGHRTVNITNILTSDAGGGGSAVLAKRLYVKLPGWSDFNEWSTLSPAGTSDSIGSNPSFDANQTPPATLDGLDHLNVYDNFGSPTNMPLIGTILGLSQPQLYARFPLTRAIHADPTTGLATVSIVVCVVDKRGAQSVGKSYSITPGAIGFPQQASAAILVPQQAALTLANGDNSDIALTGGVQTYIIAGPTGAFALTGFAGGFAGRRVHVANPLAQTMTVKHDTTSTAANRIYVPGAANKAFTTQHTFLEFEYDGSASRWRLLGT